MEPDVKQRNPRNRRRERAQRMQAQREIKVKDGDSGEDESPAREKPPRPPTRRKKSKEPLGEEDIIDGFAIMAFRTYEDLQAAIKCATSTRKESLTTTTKSRVNAKPIAIANDVSNATKKEKDAKETPNSGITLLHDAGTSDDSGRASERLTSSSVAPRDPDSSRDRLSDASSRCSSGKGYICDSEGDDEKVTSDNSRNGSPRFHDTNDEGTEGGGAAFLASGGGGAMALSRAPVGGSASPAPAPLPHPAPSPAPAALPPASLPPAPPTAATAPACSAAHSPAPAPPTPSPVVAAAAYGDYRLTDHDARTKRPPSTELQIQAQSPPLNLQNHAIPPSTAANPKSVSQPPAPHTGMPAVPQPGLPAAYAGRPAMTSTASAAHPNHIPSQPPSHTSSLPPAASHPVSLSSTATHPNGLPNGAPPHTVTPQTLPHISQNGYPNHISSMHRDRSPNSHGSLRHPLSHLPPASVANYQPPVATSLSHPFPYSVTTHTPKHSVHSLRTPMAASAPPPSSSYFNSHPTTHTGTHSVTKHPPTNYSISNHLNSINNPTLPYLNHSISNHLVPTPNSSSSSLDTSSSHHSQSKYTSPAVSKPNSNVSHSISNHIGEHPASSAARSGPSPVTSAHSNSHSDFRATNLVSNQSTLRAPTPSKDSMPLVTPSLPINGFPPTYPSLPYPSLYAPYATNSPYVPLSVPSPRTSVDTRTTTSSSPLVASKTPKSSSIVAPPPLSHSHSYSPRGPSPLRDRDSYSSGVSSLSRTSVTPVTTAATSLAVPTATLPSLAAPLTAAPPLTVQHTLAPVPTVAAISSAGKPPAHWGIGGSSNERSGAFAGPERTAAAFTGTAPLFPAPLPPPPHNPHPFSAESLFQTSPSADLIRRELDSRFLAAAGAASAGPALPPAAPLASAPAPPMAPTAPLGTAPSLGPSPTLGANALGGVSLRTEMHHHQHQHTHVHQHPPHHLYPPPPPHHPHLLKDMSKMPLYRTGLGYGAYPPSLLPTASPFLAPAPLPAFAPKPLAVGADPSIKTPRPTPTKTGKWNAMHVRIAWEIYNHQQKGADKEKRTVPTAHYPPPPYLTPHPLSLAGVSPFARYGAGAAYGGASPFAFPGSYAAAADWRQRAEERARRERAKPIERTARPRSPIRSPLRNGDKEPPRLPPAPPPTFAPPPPLAYDPYRGLDPLHHMRFAPYVEAAIRAEEDRAKLLSAYAKVPPPRHLPPPAPPPHHHLDLLKKEEPR